MHKSLNNPYSFTTVIVCCLLVASCTTTNTEKFSKNFDIDKQVNAGGTVDITQGYYLVDQSGGGCVPRLIPIITITRQPKNGTAKIVKGRRIPRQSGCKNIKVETVRVAYQSNGTTGLDHLEYTVRYRNSRLGTWHVSAIVEVQ